MQVKRSKKVRVILLVVVVLTILTSCDFTTGTGDIKAGKWEGDVFTNEWSGVKVKLPSGYTSLSKDQMKELIGQSEEILINDVGLSEKQVDKAKTQLLYDFIIKFPDQTTNLSLSYENMSFKGKVVSENDYLDQVKEQFDRISQIDYTFVKSQKEEVAGKKFTVAYFSLNSGAAYQCVYMRKIDTVMMLIITTYLDSTENQMKDFINSIEKA